MILILFFNNNTDNLYILVDAPCVHSAAGSVLKNSIEVFAF